MEILLDFQKKTNIEIIGFILMHFGFALVLSDIDLGNKSLLGTHLDLLDTNISSKSFVSVQDILKKHSIHVFKTSSRHVFKTSWRHVFNTSLIHLQRNNCSSRTSSRRLQDVLRTSSRRLENQQIHAGLSIKGECTFFLHFL